MAFNDDYFWAWIEFIILKQINFTIFNIINKLKMLRETEIS